MKDRINEGTIELESGGNKQFTIRLPFLQGLAALVVSSSAVPSDTWNLQINTDNGPASSSSVWRTIATLPTAGYVQFRLVPGSVYRLDGGTDVANCKAVVYYLGEF